MQNLVILVTGQVYLHVVSTPVEGSGYCTGVLISP